MPNICLTQDDVENLRVAINGAWFRGTNDEMDAAWDIYAKLTPLMTAYEKMHGEMYKRGPQDDQGVVVAEAPEVAVPEVQGVAEQP